MFYMRSLVVVLFVLAAVLVVPGFQTLANHKADLVGTQGSVLPGLQSLSRASAEQPVQLQFFDAAGRKVLDVTRADQSLESLATQSRLANGVYLYVATVPVNGQPQRRFGKVAVLHGKAVSLAPSDEYTVPTAPGPGPWPTPVVYKCNGVKATIVGTSGDDTILGTPGNDVIVGRGGNDKIYGLGGNDILCGDAGNDRLVGGSGNDRIFGGENSDTLIGDFRNDSLEAGDTGLPGNDRLEGGSGDDFLYGNPGDDRLLGGAGADWLEGDDIYSNAYCKVTDPSYCGNDRLEGGSGSDFLFGQFGNDYLTGGSGFDTLDGDAGIDTCYGEQKVACDLP